MLRVFSCGLALLAVIGTASAAPITPAYDTFGNLPGATFGGSGIPTDPTAITTIVDGSNTITLGLTAFARFSNPALGNNGAGVYAAAAGANYGDPGNLSAPIGSPSSTLGATWNLGFYVNIAGGGTFANYEFELLYDFDPTAGTEEADHGVLNLNNALTALAIPLNLVSNLQDSQNLLFGYLAVDSSFVDAPSVTPFNPNALGEYTLALRVSNLSDEELGRSAIQVNAVPEPSTLALLSIGGLSLVCGGWRRRRNQQA